MQTISQSVFLQALAYALINSIWQMGLLWLAVVFILRILNLSSSQKFSITFLAQVCGLIAFIYTLLLGYNHQQSLRILKDSNISSLNNFAVFLKYAKPFIAAFYIIFLVHHLTRLLFTYRFTQTIRSNNLVKIPVANRIFVEELTTLFSLRRKVKIYLSKTIRCPLTIGFLKPIILIPMGAINNLTQEQMEAVILHELAHIKRADYLLYLLQCFIERIFFFNIFSKLINDIMERERENACDDWVIQFKYNSFHYAEALLKLGKLQTVSSLAMAASGKKDNTLLYRIKRLVHHDSEKNNLYEYSSMQLSILTLIIALGLLVSFSSKTSGLIVVSNNQPVVVSANKNNYNKIYNVNNSSFTFLSIKKNKTALVAINKKDITKTQKNKSTFSDLKKLNKLSEHTAAEYDYTKKISPDYFVSTSRSDDSAKQPSYSDASNKQLILNNDAFKKAISYQNFKQLETMLAITGDSISVTEDPQTKDNYKKLITIETIDKKGNKNIYKVVVELYQ